MTHEKQTPSSLFFLPSLLPIKTRGYQSSVRTQSKKFPRLYHILSDPLLINLPYGP